MGTRKASRWARSSECPPVPIFVQTAGLVSSNNTFPGNSLAIYSASPARITDRATFAYLADVYVLESHRGRGLGQWLVECVTAHPDLQGLRRWNLATRDAHGLYRKLGFAALRAPERYMEKVLDHPYREAAAS